MSNEDQNQQEPNNEPDKKVPAEQEEKRDPRMYMSWDFFGELPVQEHEAGYMTPAEKAVQAVTRFVKKLLGKSDRS